MYDKDNSKRVAKNTLILYGRMIIMMVIGLYTSRIILQVLGIQDYGVNNVIGGFLNMFSIVTTSMTSAVSRFVTVELGHDDYERRQKVFTTTVSVMILLGILLLILIESIGVYFLNNGLNIPTDRLYAAQWVLHISAIGTFVSLVMVPYGASVIAHEKMSVFAYLTILDALFKLGICYAIYVSPFDKLISYSLLGLITSLIVEVIYWYYCYSNFSECRYNFKFYKKIFKEIWTFASWNFIGQSSWILNTQGINMLINIFFGVYFNAARGIAEQVNQKVNQFVSGFMTSLNPQITKSYASGDKAYSYKLACRGARFSFYIMFIMALPIMLESNYILRLWLGTPPEHADVFVVWTILQTLIILLGSTLVTLQFAHGDIKKYQLVMTSIGCIPFPATYLLFKYGAPPLAAYWVFVVVYWILIFVRYHIVHQSTGIPAKMYLYGVIFRCHVIGVVAAIIPLFFMMIMESSFMRLMIITFSSVIISCIIIYYWGIDNEERIVIISQIKKRLTFVNNRVKINN